MQKDKKFLNKAILLLPMRKHPKLMKKQKADKTIVLESLLKNLYLWFKSQQTKQ